MSAPARPALWDWVALCLLFGLSAFAHLITYSHLGEDAYISFRYAQQLASGNGIVFNIGEPSEGYSNLLWVWLLAAAEFLGARMDLAARVLSVAFLCGAMGAAWWCVPRVTPGSPRWMALWCAAAVGFHPLLRYHLDRGLETVTYASCLGMGLLIAAGAGRWWLVGICGAAATLLRPEGVGFAWLIAVPVLVRILGDGSRRAALIETLKVLALPTGAFLGQLLFRRVVYGVWLPNTVYAKVHGGSGAGMEIVRLVASHGGVPVLAVMGCGLAWGRAPLRPLAAGVLAMLLGAMAFQWKAGVLANEAWRYMVAAFIPCSLGLWLLLHCVLHQEEAPVRARRDSGEPTLRLFHRVLAVVLLLYSMVLFAQVPEVGKSRLLEGNRDALRSRFHVRVLEFLRKPDLAFHREWYLHEEIFVNALAGRWMRENLPPDATIVADQLGQMGYFAAPTQRFIDPLGLMTRDVALDIARQGASADFLARYVTERNPDYFVLNTFSESAHWPAELRGQPILPQLRQLIADHRIAARWRPTEILAPRETLTNVTFTVYTRDAETTETRTILLGPDTEEFNRWWRVLD